MQTLTEAIAATPEFEIPLSDPRLAESTAFIDEHLKSRGLDHYFDLANEPQQSLKDGLKWALVAGSPEAKDNKSSVLFMGCPFGNQLWPHMFARADALSAWYEEQTGTPVQVMLAAAPGDRSRYGLDREHLDRVKKGDFFSVGGVHLEPIYNNFEKVEGIVAYSGSSAFASDMAQVLATERDGIGNVVLGAPPHARKQMLGSQLLRFVAEGARFSRSIKRAGVEVIDQIFESGAASPNFLSGIWQQRDENIALAQGYGRGNLADDLFELNSRAVQAIVIHGSKDLVAPRRDVIASVRAANESASHVDRATRTHRVEVTGANHSFGDRIGQFIGLSVAALQI